MWRRAVAQVLTKHDQHTGTNTDVHGFFFLKSSTASWLKLSFKMMI